MRPWDAIGPGPVREKVAVLASSPMVQSNNVIHVIIMHCHEYTIPWGIWIFASHGRGLISPRSHFHLSPIQLFSWLACSVTRPLQPPVWWLRLVQSKSYLPPLAPSQSRLETQLSQSRVFPPSLTQFSDSQRQRSRRVPEKSLAVILVTILRVFSSHCMQWGACSKLQASTHPLLQNEVCSAKPTAVHMLSLKYCQNSW